MPDATEQWRPIRALRDEYEASSLGRVRSAKPGRAPRVLTPRLSDKGYLTFSPSIDGRVGCWPVHKAVLHAFVGPRPNGMQACHRDTDRTNNALSNLRWDTPPENYGDTRAAGRDHNLNKTHCKRRHAYDAENTRVTAAGHRQCRACARISDRKRAQRRRSRDTNIVQPAGQ